MDLCHDGLKDTLDYLHDLCDESEACCHRIVLLGGADLLISCFENSKPNENICQFISGIFASLAQFPSLHTQLMSPRAMNMLVQAIQKLDNEYDLAYCCLSLSFFLCSTNAKWPEQCPSRDEVSAFVTDTCKKCSLSVKAGRACTSFQSVVFLLAQTVSEAAKYYPVWALYLCVHQHPDLYCPMLVRDGVISVLKQQTDAHEYVQGLSKLILKKFEEYCS